MSSCCRELLSCPSCQSSAIDLVQALRSREGNVMHVLPACAHS